MAKYRKRIDSDIWHWSEDCSNWPKENYAARSSKPTSGKLCDECKTKNPEEVIVENK